MKKEGALPVQLLLYFSLISALILSGCGYSVYRQAALPFTSIQIGTIENKTLDPKLQDKLYAALTEEFMKNGIMVGTGADTKLSAVINTFDMFVLSEKEGLTVEYRVVISAGFTIEAKDREKELKKIDSPFIVSLTASEKLSTLLAVKDLAEEKALRDIAMRVVGALIYK